ncbi:unnamed protein product, partial [Ectocarpus sp. 13 AM-2016]
RCIWNDLPHGLQFAILFLQEGPCRLLNATTGVSVSKARVSLSRKPKYRSRRLESHCVVSRSLGLDARVPLSCQPRTGLF